MKLKKNQVMITALAIMIAIAGYLNFAGNQMKEETLVVTDEVISEEEMAALLDLSEEDILSDIGSEEDAAVTNMDSVEEDVLASAETTGEEATDSSDIESLDEDAVLTSNYISDSEEEVVVDVSSNEEEAMDEIMEGTPGEAVFTSTQAVSTLSAAKVLKEQTRAKNKDALEQIMNNEVLASAQKEEAVANMVAMAQRSEKEVEAEILLSAKGFTETVVSIGENSVDVVVCMEELTDAHLAQIMDIVTRKTNIPEENIIISTVNQK